MSAMSVASVLGAVLRVGQPQRTRVHILAIATRLFERAFQLLANARLEPQLETRVYSLMQSITEQPAHTVQRIVCLPRPTTERVISEEECKDLAGWTIKTMYTFRDRSYHSYTSPDGKQSYKSKLQALRAATGTAMARKNTPAALAGPYPSRRNAAARAARAGKDTMHGDTPVRCIDPRRSYAGPQIPRSGRAPAGDDLPGWEIERMSALDGKDFLLYYDPNGRPVGSRGSALKATGQLFITASERNAMCTIKKDKQLRQKLLERRINISQRGALARHDAVQNAHCVYEVGEFEQLINARCELFTLSATYRYIQEHAACTCTAADEYRHAHAHILHITRHHYPIHCALPIQNTTRRTQCDWFESLRDGNIKEEPFRGAFGALGNPLGYRDSPRLRWLLGGLAILHP